MQIREEPSAWDPATGKALLQHTDEDKELKIRPYFPVTMEVTKCHEDVQQADGNGAVLRYVATYSLKFSDSMDQDWLNDQASDYSVARRILFCYRPLEPEMWLTLAQERFPQVDYQGTLVDIAVPLPDCSMKPKWLQNYEASSWRCDGMSLLEFLRKTNASGDIIRHIKQGHVQHVRQVVERALVDDAGRERKEAVRASDDLLKAYRRSLKEAAGDEATAGTLANFVNERLGIEVSELVAYANAYAPQGEKLVAASSYSMLNDRYYGQWVVLHVPFRDVANLQAAVAGDLAKALGLRMRGQWAEN